MKIKNRLFSALFFSLLITTGFLSGCDNQGPAEEVGENVDEAAKDTKRGIEDITD